MPVYLLPTPIEEPKVPKSLEQRVQNTFQDHILLLLGLKGDLKVL